MTFKERLDRIDLAEQNAALQKLEADLRDDGAEAPPPPYAEEGVRVHCSECGTNTFREEHSAIMCSNCGHGPFCNYCWQVHIREFHPTLVQPYEDARRGFRRRGRLLKHYLIRTVVKPAGLLLGLAALLTAAYFAYVGPSTQTVSEPPAAVGADRPSALAVELFEGTAPVRRNAVASLVVKAVPTAACTIEVRYRSGPSRAGGLEPRIADASGLVRWSWRVGRNTTTGAWPIQVVCKTENQTSTLDTSLVVTE